MTIKDHFLNAGNRLCIRVAVLEVSLEHGVLLI